MNPTPSDPFHERQKQKKTKKTGNYKTRSGAEIEKALDEEFKKK